MADSDDEYDGRRRDKFVRERNDYSNRSNLSSSGWQDSRQDNRSETWSSSHRPQSNYQSQRTDPSYAPKRDRYGNQQSFSTPSNYEPSAKRSRPNHWVDDRPPQSNYDSNNYNDNSYNNSNPNELTLTQPAYMSFKQFMRGLDDSIDHHEAAKRYNEYKLEFKRKQIVEFFNAHKDEEWFRIKYHPVESVKRKKELKSYVKHRAMVFMDLYKKGLIESTTVNIERSDQITNVLDSIVIKLEGGTDHDLKCLETPPPLEQTVSKDTSIAEANQIQEGSNTPAADLSKDDDMIIENGVLIPKPDLIQKKEDITEISDDEKPMEETVSKNKESDEIDETKEDGEADDEPETKETGGSTSKTNCDELKANTEINNNIDNKELTNNVMNDENAPRPLHKTLSIFLRYLPRDVTKDEVVKMFQAYPGYLRVALADPTFDKRFQRRGWVTFDRNVDIRKIYISLTNVKIRDCEFGAIVNRDLSRRIRSVNGIASHRNCVLADLKHTTQIILNLDEERGVWVENMTEPVENAAKQQADQNTPTVDDQTKLDEKTAQSAEQSSEIDEECANDEKPLSNDNDSEQQPSVTETQTTQPQPIQETLPEYKVEGLSEKITVFGQETRNPLLVDIEQVLKVKAESQMETVNEETGEIKEEEVNELEPKQLEHDEELIKVLDKLVFYLRVVHSLDFYNHIDYPNEDEMPNRIGIMHARGMKPTANITLKEVNDYIRQFASRISPYLERSVQLNDDDVDKLGPRKVEDEIEKFIAENTKELKADKWLCPLSGKKFKGPSFVRKHIETKHQDKLEIVKQETEFFNLYLRDPRRPMLAEHPSNKPGYSKTNPQHSTDHQSTSNPHSNYNQNSVHQRVNFSSVNRYSSGGWSNSYNQRNGSGRPNYNNNNNNNANYNYNNNYSNGLIIIPLPLRFNQMEETISRRSKVIYTISLNVSYFVYGIGSSMLGLTLIDMANLLEVTLRDVSIGLSVKSIFYSIGSLMCILSLNRFNRQFQFALSFMFLGIGLTLIPISRNLNQYYLWNAVAGVCSAAIEISCNVWMLEIWKEENHRHMQSLNFFLCLGNILAPLITVPYLSSDDKVIKDIEPNLNATLTVHNLTDTGFVKSGVNPKYLDILLSSTDDHNINSTTFNDHRLSIKTQIHIPYAIIGFIIFLTGLAINILYLFVPYDDASNKRKEDEFSEGFVFHISSQKKVKKKKFSLSNIYYWSILVLCCTISCFHFAMTLNNSNYIQLFGVESDVHLTKMTSTYLMLAYSCVLTFSCFCFVFISAKLSPKLIILIDLILMFAASCLLIYFDSRNELILWISIVMLAIGMSSIYPSLYSYMKQNIDVNNNVGSLIVFSSGFISIFYPIIETNIERFPLIFPYINLFSLIIMIVLYVVLVLFELFYNSRQKKQLSIIKSLNQEEIIESRDAYDHTHM